MRNPKKTPPPHPAFVHAARRGGVLKIVLIVAIVLVLALGVLVALLPALASGFAASTIAREAGKATGTTGAVGSASLSWTGGQRVESLVLTDRDGREAANVTVDISAGLLGIIASRDLGTITVTGDATAVRSADGTLNLAPVDNTNASTAAKPAGRGGTKPATSPAGSPALPGGLRATLVLDSLNVRYLDEASSTAVALPDIDANAAISTANPITVTLSAPIVRAASLDALGTDAASAGTLSVDATITGLVGASGAFDTTGASIDATAKAEGVAMAVLDALLSQGGRLTGAMGPTADATIGAKGTFADLAATLDAKTEAITADAALRIKDNTLTLDRPAKIVAQTQRLAEFVPELRDQLLTPSDQAGLDALPTTTLTLSTLRVSLPENLAAISLETLDLSSAAIAMALDTEQITGRTDVPVPGGSRLDAFTLGPISATLSSDALRDGVRLAASPSATLAGTPAGTIDLDARLNNLLASDGTLRDDPASAALNATLAVRSLATAIAQPFADAAGLDLVRDLGPTLDVELVASTIEGGRGSIPDADIRLTASAENLQAAGALEARNAVVRTAGEGVTLTLRSLGPTLARALQDQQAQIETPGWATLSLTDLVAPLDTIKAGDFRGTGAVVGLKTGPVAGSLVPAASGSRTPFRVAPITLTLRATDLAEPVRLTTEARAKGDGAALGTLTADLTIAQLLGEGGGFAGVPGRADGRVDLVGFATPMLQPLVAGTGLNLPRDIGPTLDASLVAKTTEAAGTGSLPAATVDINVSAESLSLSAPVALDRGALRTRDAGVTLKTASAGRLAGAFAKGFDVAPTGELDASITDLVVPIDDTLKPRLGEARAKVAVRATNMSARLREERRTAAGEAIPALAVRSLDFNATLPLNGDPRMQFAGDMAFGNQAFTADGQMRLAGLLGTTPEGGIEVNAMSAAPVGTIRARGVPSSLVRLVPTELTDANGNPVRLTQLARQTIGDTLDVTFQSQPRNEGQPWPLDATLAVRSEGLTVDHASVLTQSAIEVKPTSARLTLAPAAFATLLDTFAAGATSAFESRPALSAPATARVDIEPFTVPLTDARLPDIAALGKQSAKATATIDASTTPLTIAGDPSTGSPPLDLGPITLKDMALVAEARLAGILADSGQHPASVALTGSVLGQRSATLATLEGRAQTKLRAAAAVAPIAGNLSIGSLDPKLADALAGTPRLVSGALGGTTSLALTSTIDPTRANAETGKRAPLIVELSIDSPNLKTTSPAKLWVRTARADLTEPLGVSWTMPPAWASEFLLGTPPGSNDAAAPKFAAPTTFDASVGTLAIGIGGNGPLKPGIFALDSQITAPAIEIAAGNGTPARFRDFVAKASTPQDTSERIDFGIAMTDANGTGEEARVRLNGTLARYTDTRGAFDANTAVVDLMGRVPGFPTAVVDAFANQDGLLVDTLGPLVSLRVNADDLSRTGGTLDMRMRSERSSATIAGQVRDGVFVTDGSTDIRLTQVVEALSARLIKGMPIAAKFIKTPQDEPAVVTAPTLEVPTDGDLAKLNGVVNIDPGVLQFQTDSAFRKILSATSNNTEGLLGQNLEPLQLKINNGVITYDRYPLPIGEYTIEMQGTVDLVGKQLDLIAWVPFGAASEDMAGAFNTGVLSALGRQVGTFERLTMLPFRIKGPLSDPGGPTPDVGLFLKSAPDALLKTPGTILEDVGKGLGDLIPGQKRNRD